MQKLFASIGATVIAATIALLALILGAVILASMCSFATDQLPEPAPPALPTTRPLPTATAVLQAPAVVDVPVAGVVPQAAASAPSPDAGVASFAGTWLVREYVIEGPGAGQLTTYELRLVQDGTTLTGSGGGLSLQGRVQGQTADLEYSRASGPSGVFTWTLVRDGAVGGVFTSSASGKGLISMQRLP